MALLNDDEFLPMTFYTPFQRRRGGISGQQLFNIDESTCCIKACRFSIDLFSRICIPYTNNSVAEFLSLATPPAYRRSLRHSSPLSHCSDNAGSLTHCTVREFPGAEFLNRKHLGCNCRREGSRCSQSSISAG